MPDNAAQATQWGLVIVAMIGALGGGFTTYLNRRSSADSTREQGRQYDITTVIKTLQETTSRQETEMKALRLTVTAHEETIQAQRIEIVELRSSNMMATARLGEQSTVIAGLRARVLELEGKALGGC